MTVSMTEFSNKAFTKIHKKKNARQETVRNKLLEWRCQNWEWYRNYSSGCNYEAIDDTVFDNMYLCVTDTGGSNKNSVQPKHQFTTTLPLLLIIRQATNLIVMSKQSYIMV